MKANEFQNPKYFFWITTALVLFYFVWSLIPPFTLSLATETQAATRPPLTAKNTDDTLTGSAPSTLIETLPFARKYQECLQIFSQPSATNPTELFKKIQNEFILDNSQVGIENFHLINLQGLERRLHVRQKGDAREVLVLDVDAEGLPILRSHQTSNETILKDLLKDGRIQFHSKKESLSFQNGFMAEIEWVNEKIHDLQIFSPSRSFSCRDLDCKCD